MSAQMGAKILSLWNYAPLGHLDFADEHFINCPVYDGSSIGHEERMTWQGHLAEVTVILIDIHICLHFARFGQTQVHT